MQEIKALLSKAKTGVVGNVHEKKVNMAAVVFMVKKTTLVLRDDVYQTLEEKVGS